MDEIEQEQTVVLLPSPQSASVPRRSSGRWYLPQLSMLGDGGPGGVHPDFRRQDPRYLRGLLRSFEAVLGAGLLSLLQVC